MNPDEPEAADSLHYNPVEGDGDVFFSLLLPVVHNRLLCFTDVEMDVVVLAPKCQGSDLLISKLDDSIGAMGGHAVMREQGVQERAEHTVLGGSGVEGQGGGCVAAYPHSWGSDVRKFGIQSHRAMLSPNICFRSRGYNYQ